MVKEGVYLGGGKGKIRIISKHQQENLDAQSNGLTFLIDRMKGQSIYAHITLEKGERSLLAELASDLL